VSDPPRSRARNLDRGVAEGVAHAPGASSLLLTTALTETRAAQSAARFTAAKWLRAKDIWQFVILGDHVDSAAGSSASRAPRRGNAAPASAFPPLFLRFREFARHRTGLCSEKAPPSRWRRPTHQPLRGISKKRIGYLGALLSIRFA